MPVTDSFHAQKRKYVYNDENINDSANNFYMFVKEKKAKTEDENHWNISNLFDMNGISAPYANQCQSNASCNDVQMNDCDMAMPYVNNNVNQTTQLQEQFAPMPQQQQQIKPNNFAYDSILTNKSNNSGCWKETMWENMYAHRSHFF